MEFAGSDSSFYIYSHTYMQPVLAGLLVALLVFVIFSGHLLYSPVPSQQLKSLTLLYLQSIDLLVFLSDLTCNILKSICGTFCSWFSIWICLKFPNSSHGKASTSNWTEISSVRLFSPLPLICISGKISEHEQNVANFLPSHNMSSGLQQPIQSLFLQKCPKHGLYWLDLYQPYGLLSFDQNLTYRTA